MKPVPNESKKRLAAFIDFVDDHKPVPIATEISLYSNEKDPNSDRYVYPYAGTADQVMMIDGKLWLIDIKTGAEYPKDQQLQLTAYKILYDELYGDITGEIDQLACLFLTKTGKYKLKKMKFVENAWNDLINMGYYCFSDMRGTMPKVKEPEELPVVYTLKENKNEGEDKDGIRK